MCYTILHRGHLGRGIYLTHYTYYVSWNRCIFQRIKKKQINKTPQNKPRFLNVILWSEINLFSKLDFQKLWHRDPYENKSTYNQAIEFGNCKYMQTDACKKFRIHLHRLEYLHVQRDFFS